MDQDIEKNILKSNTSIVGIVCRDGVVLAGDRRVTAGHQIVMNKNYGKISTINEYLISAFTGVVSDKEIMEKIIAAELRLKELKTKCRPSVKEATSLIGLTVYRNIRTPSMIPSIVGTLIAGYDEDGTTSLYTIEPSGGIYKVEDYDANFSSGMPYILGLLERNYKKDLSVKEGIELARDCIKAAIERDPGSGNGIDVFSVSKEGIKHVVSEEIIPEYK